MNTTLPATRAADLLTGLDGAFLAYGDDAGGDVDAAFDDATEQAGYDYGFANLTPSLAGVSADQVTVTVTDPVTLERALLLAARALHRGDLEPGTAYAVPICKDSTYRRRRVRVTLTDPTLEVAEQPGNLPHVPPGLETTLRQAAEAAGTPVADDELLEAVAVTTARHWYKPLVTPFTGPSAAEYVVLDPVSNQIVAAGHRTAGDARRTAVTLAKAGPVAGSATGHLDVVKLTRRAGGNPFARIVRNRVKSKLVVKLTFGAVKNATKVKTVGWLFYGATEVVTEPAGAPDEGTVAAAADLS